MTFRICKHCAQPFLVDSHRCPHCATSSRSILPVMLGLSLLGCGTSEKDTGEEVTIQPENVEPPYGVGAYDEDGDGFPFEEDCNDTDPATYPGAAYNESNNLCMQDRDGDGYGASEPEIAEVSTGADCNDDDATIHPQAEEVQGDGVDQNCDGTD